MAFSGSPSIVTPLQRLENLGAMIGRTPLLAVHLNWKGERSVVHAKAEYFNFTGSTKDRMALNILRCGYISGALKAGHTLVEATSGSAGIAIAALGRALGHPVKIFMPDWMSEERKCLLRSLGAELVLVSREEGGFLGALAAAEDLAETRDDVFLTRQFSNTDNCGAHTLTTGPEILSQLASVGRVPNAFVAGVGTGGTVMGVGNALRSAVPAMRVHPMQPAESPTLSTGYKVGSHRIQGLTDDFIPSLVDLSALDEVISVNDGDAIIMAQNLAAQLGLAVGISSGANMIAALKVQDLLGPDATVATIFCDDNKKYLSTDLARVEPVKAGYIAPQVELLGFETIASAAA